MNAGGTSVPILNSNADSLLNLVPNLERLFPTSSHIQGAQNKALFIPDVVRTSVQADLFFWIGNSGCISKYNPSILELSNAVK